MAKPISKTEQARRDQETADRNARIAAREAAYVAPAPCRHEHVGYCGLCRAEAERAAKTPEQIAADYAEAKRLEQTPSFQAHLRRLAAGDAEEDARSFPQRTNR